MRKKTPIFSLKTILISVLVGVILLLFLVIIAIFYNQNESVAVKVATQLEIMTSKSVIKEFENYINNAENSVKVLDKLISNKLIKVDAKNDILANLQAIIKTNLLIESLYLADFKGNFYMAKRFPDATVSTRYVYRSDDKIISRWEHEHNKYDTNFPPYSEHSLEEGYDPRKRPWYKNALESEITWGDPYIFASDKQVGITGTKKIVWDNFEGVVSVDVSLLYLSEFLDNLFFSSTGAVLVSNAKGQIIAYNDTFLSSKTQRELVLAQEKDIITISNILLSKEIAHAINIIQFRAQGPPTYKTKPILELLTDLFFPSRTLNRIENLSSGGNSITDIFEFENNKFIYTKDSVDKFKGIDWEMYFLIEDEVLVGNFRNTIKITIMLLAVIFLIILIYYTRFLGYLSNRIGGLSLLMQNITRLDLKERFVDAKKLKIRELAEMGAIYNTIILSLSSFKKFIPKEVIQYSIDRESELQPEMESREQISILFSDIVGFTTITEKYSPEQLAEALHVYFTHMSDIIEVTGGIIDKFIGDAIMALYGVFESSSRFNQAEQSCFSALKMQMEHKKINDILKEKDNKITFQTRIGINTGPALVGLIGSSGKLNHTAIGDSVNVASRLETLNKQYSTSIIISESTKNLLRANFICKKIGSVNVKGKDEATTIYKLIGYKKDQHASNNEQETLSTDSHSENHI